MQSRLISVSTALLAAVLLAGCGTPGAPLPPSLHLPRPVDDLHAVRIGNVVHLRWTQPDETTDGQGITHAGATRVCRDFRGSAGCGAIVTEFPAGKLAPGAIATSEEDVSPLVANFAADFVTYAIESLNSNGRSAGPSNIVTVFLAPALPPPPQPSAKVVPEGVELTWPGPRALPESRMKSAFFYRVLRLSPGASAPVPLADLPADVNSPTAAYVDNTVEWEKAYDYRVAGLTRVLGGDGRELYEFLGEVSPVMHVLAHDVFPPAAPQGLQAVSSGTSAQAFIDLTWSPNAEPDLAGYNVYRSETGAASSTFVKVNSALVKTPAFRDDHVQRGESYVYAVSAVDTQNNESARSATATEKVPQ